MGKTLYSKSYNYKGLYPNLRLDRLFEGGIEFSAHNDGKYIYIIDSSTMCDFVCDIYNIAISIIEFERMDEFEEYVQKRKNRF